MEQDTAGMLTAAHAWATAGCSVVPARTDGTKAPAAFWKQYQTQRASPEQVRTWLTSGAYDGFGVIPGAVSGGLEMFELEGRAMAEGYLDRYVQALKDHGYGELWNRIIAGYSELTPSGGLHLFYRVDAAARANTKLARRPSTPEELAAWKVKQQEGVDAEEDPAKKANRQRALDGITRGEQVPQVLIETRGEGGYVVVAPSAGRTHESGKAWTLLRGGPGSIATITEDERDALYAIATLLDEMPEQAAPARPFKNATSSEGANDGARPGDDYNLKADWDDILSPHGWTHVQNYGRARGWRRPGKNRGVSATTGNNDGDNLYVFSSSTEFEVEHPYSKFAAYALLEHGGDYGRAAKELRRQGYGGERLHGDENLHELIADYTPPPASQGNLALAPVHQLHNTPQAHLSVAGGHTLRYSDDRLALTLVEQFGDVIRYCPDRGQWLAWDGVHWGWCERGGGKIREHARQLGRSLPDEAKADTKFKQRALSASGVTACLALAQTDPRIVVGTGDLDAHPWELNTPGGIVNLKTGELGPCDPARLHTRVALCTPDPESDLTVWNAFLDTTFGGDAELISYLQRLLGYSATGYIGPHVLPFAFGGGGNGKGVFLEAAQKILGDYATTSPVGFLMSTTYQGHETEIARLAGARMVLCSEVNEGDKFDEARVKQLTGGDTLTARYMRQDHFTFTPTHHLWLMGNSRPAVTSGGRAFWRRLRLVPFTHDVPDDQIIDDFQGILAREHGPAILAWMVQGAVQFAQQGLNPEPEMVTSATEEYKNDQDTVARFVEECCRIGGGDHVSIKVSIVRAAYEKWCVGGGDTPVSAKALTQELTRKHEVGRARNSGGSARFYSNLSLIGDESDEDEREQGWVR